MGLELLLNFSLLTEEMLGGRGYIQGRQSAQLLSIIQLMTPLLWSGEAAVLIQKPLWEKLFPGDSCILVTKVTRIRDSHGLKGAKVLRSYPRPRVSYFPFSAGGTQDGTKALLCDCYPTLRRRNVLNFLVLKPPPSILVLSLQRCKGEGVD